MKDYLKKERTIILVILSGILSGLAFTFENISLVIWISFVPLLYIILSKAYTYLKTVKYVFLFGVSYYLVILHWIFTLYPFDWIGLSNTESAIILILGWIFISIIEGSVIGFIIGTFYFIKIKNNVINVLSIAFLWVLAEYIQEIGVLGFPWGRLAVSQVNSLAIIQSVSLFGSLFIGFLIMIFNGLVVISIINYKENKYISIRTFVIAIIIFILNISYGFVKISINEDKEHINVSIVQGNINSAQKWNLGDERRNLELYKELTDEAVNLDKSFKTEIIVWPETAIPIDISKSNWILDEYKNIAVKYNSLFVTGTFYTNIKNNNEYNSVISINKNGDLQQIYYKRHLVPFGEVLPYEKVVLKLIPTIKKLNLFNGNLKEGTDSIIIDNNNINIGSLICFESIFPKLARENINNGAEALIVVTNDSWFKDSKAAWQHNKNAILRAVENNRYIVRAANTGISCVISNRGKIIDKLDLLESGYLNSYVDVINAKSFYTIYGDYIVYIAIVFLALIKIKVRSEK